MAPDDLGLVSEPLLRNLVTVETLVRQWRLGQFEEVARSLHTWLVLKL